MPQNTPSPELLSGIRKLIRRHGAIFQDSIANDLLGWRNRGELEWSVEACEFPVATPHHNSHVDIILRHEELPCYACIECKNVDPNRWQWIFLHRPLASRRLKRQHDIFVAELTQWDHSRFESFGATTGSILDNATHDGFAVPTKLADGNDAPNNDGRRSIQDALTQVSVHVNGLVQHVGDRFTSSSRDRLRKQVVFVPLIVTSAPMYLVTEPAADSDMSAIPVDTVFYQHHVSPRIKSTFAANRGVQPFASALDYDFLRTVIITNRDSLKATLNRIADRHLDGIRPAASDLLAEDWIKI